MDYSGGDNGTQQLFALNDFYQKQAEIYQKYLADQKDYYSYNTEMLMAGEVIQQAIGGQAPQEKRQERTFAKKI